MLATIKFPFSCEPLRLQADLTPVRPGEWMRRFSPWIYEGDWSGAARRSGGGQPRQIYPDPTATDRFADTEILARCAYYRDVLDTFQCPLTSVRLLKLKARSSIREHRDYKLGLEDGELRLHVPIVTNPAVAFFLAGERVPMAAGDCWYLNVNLPHRVDNQSDTDRVHLVIDCVLNDWLWQFFPTEAKPAQPAAAPEPEDATR